MSVILQNTNENSLIIIDELARSNFKHKKYIYNRHFYRRRYWYMLRVM